MPPVDSLLKLFVDHGADELRLSSGEQPRMSQRGRQLKLVLPLTTDEMVQHLLGELLSGERLARLAEGAGVDFEYQPEGARSRFHVALKRRAAGGLEALFRAGGAAPRTTAPASGGPVTKELPQVAAGPVAATVAPAVAPLEVMRGPAPGPAHGLPEGAHPASAAAAAAVARHGAAVATELSAHGPLGALLSEARDLRASDLHLQSGAVPVARIDGALRPLSPEPLGSLEEILVELPGPSVRAAIDGSCAFDGTLDFEDRRVRIHVYRAAEGPAAAMRLLPGVAPALASLHLPLDLGDLAALPSGLVIVCGPAGSGKSATLAALAQEAVRRRPSLLVTLEDPIEYRVRPAAQGSSCSIVRQRQVGRDVPDFPTGLRDALREDPDILLVGEMRDAESVALALTAAETGHLVLASLHSRSAPSAIERIVDALAGRREGEVRAQLAQALRAVIGQRLIPRERGSGRAVALELLRVNHNVASLIREGKTAQLPSALQSSRKEGMLLLEASLADLVRAGVISRERAVAHANDATTLAGYLEGSS